MSEDYTVPEGLALNVSKSDEPVSRLGRIGNRMRAVLDGLGPEASDVRAIIILSDGSDGSGTTLHGYDPVEIGPVAADAITFLDALLQTAAKPARIVIQPL